MVNQDIKGIFGSYKNIQTFIYTYIQNNKKDTKTKLDDDADYERR